MKTTEHRNKEKTVYVRVSTLEQGSRASVRQQAKQARIYFSRLGSPPWNAPKCKAKPIEARLLEKSVIKVLRTIKQGRKNK